MRPANGLRLIGGRSNARLAQDIADRAGAYRGRALGLADARIERFKDSEIFVEIHENVRGEDVFVIQPTSKPANDAIMELLIITDALRRSSAQRITAVMPYFGYARQDRRTAARTPITAKLVANLMTGAGVDRVLTVDLHAGQIQGFFDIPVDNLYAAPLFSLDIKQRFPDRSNLTVVSPDVGGVVRARDLARRIGAGLAIVDKRRERAGEVAAMQVIGDVSGRDCLIIDDICDSAGTLREAAAALKEQGADTVHAYVTHGVLSEPALERLADPVLEGVTLTDSIAPRDEIMAMEKARVLTLAPLLARAILNVGEDHSVSSLFDEESIEPLYGGSYELRPARALR